MLSGTHFYHATIKRIVSVFGTLFNNITVGRHSGNKISNIQRVPISYGPSQKFITRMNVDLDGNKVAIKLPRMSFEITSIEYDTTTKLNRLNTTLTSGANNSPRTRNKMYQSVPYTIGMQLNILARNQEDALQILEQIVPTFSPEYTVTIKDIEGPGSKTDVPFILNGVSFDDTYEGDYVGRRTLTYTLDFTIRARFAPNTSSVSIIKKVETDLADFTNVTTSNAQTLSSINVSSDSPADTIRTFVSLIDPADVHTLDLVYKDITVAGVEPINRLTGISIVSGATADFDRVEDEDFSSSVTNLTGVANTGGVDASFTAIVDGLTGATTGVSILNRGSGYIASETITISTSPYDSVNLVLTVDSVFDGTGDEVAGAINTISITSGNGANTNFTSTYAPTFTKTNLATEAVLNSPNDSPGLHGAGAAVNITLDKTGAITAATIARGGADYKTTDQVKLSPSILGETESSFILQNRSTTSSGSGTDATINVTLDSQTGALSNPVIQAVGSGYALNDTLTISAVQLGANSPAGDALDTDLVLSITGVNEDGTGALTSLSITSGETTDLKRVGAKIYEYDSPFTNLVMSVDSIDTSVLNGVYSKSGRLNKKPRYVHTTTSGAEINYNGSQWILQQSNENLASADPELASSSADSPVLNAPFTQWTVVGRDTANMTISTTENLDFNVGERITGNISAGEAIVLSANNNKATVNNLEQLYAEDELVTGQQSGRTRTVFNTRKT